VQRTGFKHIFPRWGRLGLPAVLVLFALFALLAGPSVCRAGELELGSLILDNQQGHVGVRFGVRVSGLDELREELDAGTTLVLSCAAKVSDRGRLLLDKRLAQAEWSSSLSKDVLANEYVLQLPGEGKPRRDKDLASVLQAGWGALAMDLGPWAALPPGHDYRLRLDISLDRTDVPTWLRYVVFFWSFDLYPPASYELDFSY